MKLKHLLLSGILTALVAFGLLTFVLPQNVQAGQPEPTITCYPCPPVIPTQDNGQPAASRHDAKLMCDAGGVYCILDGSNNPIGHQLVCVGCR